MSLRVCSEVGCPTLIDHRSGKCEAHRRAAWRAAEAKRPSMLERGYDAEFERNRERVKRDEDVCCICGLVVDKTLSGWHPWGPVVHHLVDLRDGGDNSLENLRLAHHSCNAREARRRDALRAPLRGGS